ncbi:MAG: hypothetical protein ACM3QZ_08295 [Solirubrobacterales bacterium]
MFLSLDQATASFIPVLTGTGMWLLVALYFYSLARTTETRRYLAFSLMALIATCAQFLVLLAIPSPFNDGHWVWLWLVEQAEFKLLPGIILLGAGLLLWRVLLGKKAVPR